MSKLIGYAVIAAVLGGVTGFLIEFAASVFRNLDEIRRYGAAPWTFLIILGDILNGIKGGLIGACTLAPLGLVTCMFVTLLKGSNSHR